MISRLLTISLIFLPAIWADPMSGYSQADLVSDVPGMALVGVGLILITLLQRKPRR
jgi:hypothetical protein